MSLIIAVPASDGVVIATNGMLHHGQVRERYSSIYRLTQRSCWAATGELALIQRVHQQLLSFHDSSQSLRELLPTVGQAIKNGVRELLGMDFRTELLSSNLGHLMQLHRADFVFIEWASTPVILHLNVVGSPEWFTDRAYMLGPGDIFAGALYSKYQRLPLNTDGASTLAYRLVNDTIDTGAFGLQGPVDIWSATERGAQELDDDGLDRITRRLEAIKDHERILFEKQLESSASH